MEENKSYLPLLGAVILILALASLVALGISAVQVQGANPVTGKVAEIAAVMESTAEVAHAEETVVAEAAATAAVTPAAAAAPVVAETAPAEQAAAAPAAEAAAPAEAGAGAAPQADDAVVTAIQKGGCVACHTIPGVPGAVGIVGPNLSNIGTDGATRVEGQTAEQYIHESLVNPLAFTAPECPFGPCVAGTMPMITATLNEDEINTIVQYLVTLHGGG